MIQKILNSSIWRWKVVFAKFVICGLTFGVYKSFGVLLPYLVAGLDTDVTSIGWAYGFYGGLVYLLGPVAGALTHMYSARPVVLVGGALAATGLVLASVVSSSTEFCFAMILSGIGHGLTILPSVQPIAECFPDGFALANGVALGGASIGMMVLPPVTERFIDAYGWKGALAILGAIDFNIVIAAALMRTSELSPKKDGYVSLEENKKLSTKTSSKDKSHLTLKELLLESFDVKLFGLEPVIIFYDVTIFFFALVYSSWTVFLVPHAVANGVDAKNAAFLSTVAGFTNFFGRIMYAPVIDRDIMDSRDMFTILSAVNAVLFLTDPLFDTYLLMSFSAATAGLAIGAGNSLWTMMVKQFVDECGTGSFVSALGWACMFSGLGSLVSSPITGWLYQMLLDYDLVFQLMGAISAVIFTLLGALRIAHKYIP